MYLALFGKVLALLCVLEYFQADALIVYPPQQMRCHSKHFRRRECVPHLPKKTSYICNVELIKTKSKTPCIEGITYFVHKRKIVAVDGCRGVYIVTVCDPNFVPGTICKCNGDPHCESFDGKWSHFQGDCEYTMVRDNCNGTVATVGEPDFEVRSRFWKKNNPALKVSYVKSVTVTYNGVEITIDQGRVVTVNDVEVALPYHDAVLGITIKRSGDFIEIEITLPGLTVRFNGDMKLEISLSPEHSGEVCGYCGNYNQDPSDDWQLGPICKPLDDPFSGPITDNQHEFGVSWTDIDYAIENPECVDCNMTRVPPPELCSDPVEQADAEMVCDDIFGQTVAELQDCWSDLSAAEQEELYFSCVFDICRLGEEAVCSTFVNFVIVCLERGFTANDWGNYDYCKLNCGVNEEYLVCGDKSSEKTCSEDLTGAIADVESSCVPGCFCKDGYFRDSKQDCVLEEDCGCNYNGVYLKEDQMFFDDQICTLFECGFGNLIQQLGNITCPPPEICIWIGPDETGLQCV